MAHERRTPTSTSSRWYVFWIAFIFLSLTKCNQTTSKIQSRKFSNKQNWILESVIIPSNPDTDFEARRLYDEALKQYGDFGQTLGEICLPWITEGCVCSGTSDKVVLSCRSTFLFTIPENLPEELIELDLRANNITSLSDNAFLRLKILQELNLSDNKLQKIERNAFSGLKNLHRLSLQNCGLSSLPMEALKIVRSLKFLHLDYNGIGEADNIKGIVPINIQNLRLEGNSFERIPSKMLIGMSNLQVLNLANNRLTQIEIEDFPKLHSLQYIILRRNRIREVSWNAFLNLESLISLDLDDNMLEYLNKELINQIQLQELMISNNRLKMISNEILPPQLATLELRGNPLEYIDYDALKNLKKLKKLILSDSRLLEKLPSFENCHSLEILRVDHCNLTNIEENLCLHSPHLKSLELKFNQLKLIPNLNYCRELKLLNLASNHIVSLHTQPFYHLSQLHDLILSNNQIESISHDSFLGLKKLQTLDLEGNSINYIHENAFSNLNLLEDLNLGNNIFPTLPTQGLKRLLHLKTFNNPKLKIFPSNEAFPRIRTLVLSYAYHCCEFLQLAANTKIIESPIKEEVLFPGHDEFDFSLWNSSFNEIWPDLNVNNSHQQQYTELIDTHDNTYDDFGNPSTSEKKKTKNFDYESMGNFQRTDYIGKVKCLPTPGPFLPCEDLFDWWSLRCGVWVVFLMSLLGNGTVVFVLIFSRSKMDVPRFLVCNLAAADFFMGIYLGFLAVVDASTLGEFRMYAVPWQMSVGCQLSGFLAVLSSELSVYTLAVITLERNYAITHAMHLNKRLSLRHAGYIMSIGWIFALVMAILPLFGVSDYRKYSICLPMEIYGTGSLSYVVFLMFINGVAFLTLMGCYLKMYCAIRGSQAWNSNDSRIAKRMALLVFTDFLCWSPIAFFSLTAIFGWHLVSLEQAKVFTVFILPLNSCCNPFLYAILTKSFKKECVMICKAIEESRVTRGIGRCRHSSNFSNRQTPGNTNSLVDRSSRELPPLLPPHTCNCNKGKIPIDNEEVRKQLKKSQPGLIARFWKRVLCSDNKKFDDRRNHRHMDYGYHIAEIQKNHKRAGSMSSSDGNYSSSRSDSWRQGNHPCGIPLRLLDPRRRHTSWLITRKTSQDSNLSNSRNDSSGSNNTTQTTASSTWRISRSSGTNAVNPSSFQQSNSSRQSLSSNSGSQIQKPRLVRQAAYDEPLQQEPTSPKLNVRFLPTIPSAPDSSVQFDEDLEESSKAVNDLKDTTHKSNTLQFLQVLESSPKLNIKPP